MDKIDLGRLAAIAGGHAEARAVQVALKLGLFEALAPGDRDAGAIANTIGGDPRATMLLANALAAIQLLEKTAGTYRLSAAARRYLLAASPEYLGGMILFDGALWEEWGRLEHTVRTGNPARRADYQSTAEETARFIHAMDSLVRARGDARWMTDHYDFSDARMMVDLGGGPGTYLIEFMRRWPRARGAIYDLPATLEVARRLIAAREPWVFSRIDLVEVDYNRAELPGPVDLIFMSNIIHSEAEAENAALMSKCYRALRPGGRLLVKDHIMDDDLIEPAAGAVFSLYLMLTTHGRDYSFTEVAQWLRAAGFSGIERTALPNPPFSSSIVSARKG